MFICIYWSSRLSFSKYLRQGMSNKAENWHAILLEQYFSTYRFLDVCRWVFKSNYASVRERKVIFLVIKV